MVQNRQVKPIVGHMWVRSSQTRMMLAYRIWTWIAIALLAFGSIAVFVVFLVTSFKVRGRVRGRSQVLKFKELRVRGRSQVLKFNGDQSRWELGNNYNERLNSLAIFSPR